MAHVETEIGEACFVAEANLVAKSAMSAPDMEQRERARRRLRGEFQHKKPQSETNHRKEAAVLVQLALRLWWLVLGLRKYLDALLILCAPHARSVPDIAD